jgi:CDP-diacylglycerol--glycerol-3-phosphate 3-phosphatidyltransferase
MTENNPTPQSGSSLPMALTLARMAAGPLVAGLILWAAHLGYVAPPRAGLIYAIAATLFALAALTDWLDGYLARKTGSVSLLGAALDHCADKVLAICALVALAYAALPVDLVIATVLILGRDIAIAGLREGLAQSGRALPVSALGKWKTAAELTAIALIIAQQSLAQYGADPQLITMLAMAGSALLWFAAALALWSGARYAMIAAHSAAQSSDQPKPVPQQQSKGE